MGVGNLRGGYHLFSGGAFHAESYVVENSVVKKNGFLIDIAHESSELMHRQITQVTAVNRDRALVDVIEAWQKVGEGRLAAAALPYERHGVAGRNVKINIRDHRQFRIVAEGDVPVADMAFEVRDMSRGLRIGYGIDGGEYGIHTLHSGKAFLDGIDRFREIFGRIDDAVEDHHIIYEFRSCERGLAGKDQSATEAEHYGDGHCAEQLAHGVGERLAPLYGGGDVVEALVAVAETACDL